MHRCLLPACDANLTIRAASQRKAFQVPQWNNHCILLWREIRSEKPYGSCCLVMRNMSFLMVMVALGGKWKARGEKQSNDLDKEGLPFFFFVVSDCLVVYKTIELRWIQAKRTFSCGSLIQKCMCEFAGWCIRRVICYQKSSLV